MEHQASDQRRVAGTERALSLFLSEPHQSTFPPILSKISLAKLSELKTLPHIPLLADPMMMPMMVRIGPRTTSQIQAFD